MTHLSVQDIQTDPRQLVQRLRDGEELILEDNGVPVGKVTPFREAATSKRDVSRRIGALVGRGSFPADWKEIARDDIEAHFGGL